MQSLVDELSQLARWAGLDLAELEPTGESRDSGWDTDSLREDVTSRG